MPCCQGRLNSICVYHNSSIVKLRFDLHIVTVHIHKGKEEIFDFCLFSGVSGFFVTKLLYYAAKV